MERETRIQQPVDANMAPKVVNASAGQAWSKSWWSVVHVAINLRVSLIPFFPFKTISPDPVTLALCFFVAYLASRPTINRYTSVRTAIFFFSDKQKGIT